MATRPDLSPAEETTSLIVLGLAGIWLLCVLLQFCVERLGGRRWDPPDGAHQRGNDDVDIDVGVGGHGDIDGGDDARADSPSLHWPHQPSPVEPLRIRDQVSPEASPHLLYYAAPRIFEAADPSAAVRFAVRLSTERQGELTEHEEEDDNEEAAEIARLEAKRDGGARTTMSQWDRQRLAVLLDRAASRRDDRAARQAGRQIHLEGEPATAAPTTAVQLLELRFHNSFVPTPGRPITLVFARGGDIAAHRAAREGSASALVPALPVSGHEGVSLPPPDRLVDLALTVDLSDPYRNQGPAATSTAWLLSPLRSGLHFSRRLVESTFITPTSKLRRVPGALLLGLLLGIVASPILTALVALILAPSSPNVRYLATPHSLLSDFDALMQSTSQFPADLPIDLAAVVDLNLSARYPWLDRLDPLATPLAFTDASMGIECFLNELGSLVLDKMRTRTHGSLETYNSEGDALSRLHDYIVEAWDDFTWFHAQFRRRWWDWPGRQLFWLPGTLSTIPNRFVRDRVLLSTLADAFKISGERSIPGDLSFGDVFNLSGAVEKLEALVIRFDTIASAVRRYDAPVCSRYYGASWGQAQDHGKETPSSGGGEPPSGGPFSGEDFGSKPFSPTIEDLLDYFKIDRLRHDLETEFLGCMLAGLGPVLEHLSAAFRGPLAQARRIRAAHIKFVAEINELLRLHRLPPKVKFDGHEALVEGTPEVDGVWVVLQDGSDGPMAGSKETRINVFYLPSIADIRRMIPEYEAHFDKYGNKVMGMWYHASVNAHWGTKFDPPMSHSWEVVWEGPPLFDQYIAGWLDDDEYYRRMEENLKRALVREEFDFSGV